MNTQNIILELIKEDREDIRHAENNRVSMTNILLVIIAAILTYTFKSSSNPIESLFGSAIICGLGHFGRDAVRKFYERQLWYKGRVDLLCKAIDSLDNNLKIQSIYKEHKDIHIKENPIYAHIRMSSLWDRLFIIIMTIGGVLFFVSSIKLIPWLLCLFPSATCN